MPNSMPKSYRVSSGLKLLGLLTILTPMAACQTLTGAIKTHFVDTSCSAFTVIHYSKDDTAGTQTQVRAHNRVWHSLCDVTP